MKLIEKLKNKSQELRRDTYAIYLAYKRPDIAWYIKLLAIIVVGYALSPIDLIPDFIPILGYLDDLILIPVGIALVIRLVPMEIMDECREKAADILSENKPSGKAAAIIIVIIWLSIAIIVFMNFLK